MSNILILEEDMWNYLQDKGPNPQFQSPPCGFTLKASMDFIAIKNKSNTYTIIKSRYSHSHLGVVSIAKFNEIIERFIP